jgi:hypothetical protein
MNKLKKLSLIIIVTTTIGYGQTSELSSFKIAQVPFNDLSSCSHFNDIDINNLICSLQKEKIDLFFSKSYPNETVVFSLVSVHDASLTFAVIRYDSSNIEYYYEQNGSRKLLFDNSTKTLDRESKEYKEWINTVQKIKPGFYKQKLKIAQTKKAKEEYYKYIYMVLRKSNNIYDAGVFCFNGSEFKENESNYPSSDFREILYWVGLNIN